MNRKIFFFVLLQLSLSLPAFTQWEWELPIPQGNRLSDLFFIPGSDTGFAVGYNGTIIRTDDRGVTWDLMDSVTTANLHAGYFTSNNGFIVGNDGIILKSTDTETWYHLNSGTNYRLNTVFFTSDNIGYAAGYRGLILKTMDAGETWTFLDSTNVWALYSMYFVSADTGIIVGDSGKILRTTDAGITWEATTISEKPILNDVYFTSKNIGYICGNDGTILKTTDAGLTWTSISIVPFDDNLNAIHFYDDSVGFVVGSSGSLLTTSNGGQNWFEEFPMTPLDLFSAINLTIDSTAIICGSNGIILRRNLDGDWINATSGSHYSLNSVVFTSEGKGFAVGGDSFNDIPFMIKSEVPELYWTEVVIDTLPHYLSDIYFINPDTGYISGNGGSIFKTVDGGDTLKPIPTETNQDLFDLDFSNVNTGFAVGLNGTLIIQDEMDTLWTTISTGFFNNLYGLTFSHFFDDGYAVGEGGFILKIKNNGDQFSILSSGTSASLYDVCFPTETTGFIVGFSGTILKITRWPFTDSIKVVNSGVNGVLNKIVFPTPEIGYIAGEGGLILKTTDGGETWYRQYSGTSNALRDIYFFDENNGLIAGAGLTILSTQNGGGGVILPGIFETTTEESPVNIYPNPASTSITIDFHSAESGPIQIVLFDLAGRMMKNMENTITQSEIQPLQLDIADLETGIYLVVIKTGNKVYTKKLIIF